MSNSLKKNEPRNKINKSITTEHLIYSDDSDIIRHIVPQYYTRN